MQVESLPSWLADFWGINIEPAQALLSIIIILAVLLPVLILSKGKIPALVLSILIFLTEAFLVGIGWLPFWLLVLSISLIALSVALVTRQGVAGG